MPELQKPVVLKMLYARFPSNLLKMIPEKLAVLALSDFPGGNHHVPHDPLDDAFVPDDVEPSSLDFGNP